MKIILGAGLSGLICGALHAQATIYERNSSSFVSHRALLRFRTEAIGRALGVPFRKVMVRKAIWENGREVPPSLRRANHYSLKTRSILRDASIWNLAPAERYIAPDDLHAILADICGSRVKWDTPVTYDHLALLRDKRIPIISTLPLPVLFSLLDTSPPIPHLPPPLAHHFRFAPIIVYRYHVPGCDVFHTAYYPAAELSTYRATLTGELLTIEATADNLDAEIDEVLSAFGIEGNTDIEPRLLSHKQNFGKITPIPDPPRKALLHWLTTEWGIYSLGRFATWRNILLDDVYEDIFAIRRMMTQAQYDINLERTRT